MKKGFTLIELLLVLAIVGILASIVLASIQSHKCNTHSTKEKCAEIFMEKENGIKTSATVEDKFDRTAPTSEDSYVGYSSLGDNPTIFDTCGSIKDSESRNECEKEYRRDEGIQLCIKQYTD